MAQSVECLALDLSSGLDHMVVSSIPMLGYMPIVELTQKQNKTILVIERWNK